MKLTFFLESKTFECYFSAFEKALAYFDSKDLPSNWDKDELLGCDSEDGSDGESSDDEPSEEKDRFVAQLYQFMDDRGVYCCF